MGLTYANPDERLRELEREAATDPMAAVRLGHELNRRGLCAQCRQPGRRLDASLPPVEAGVRICDSCAARIELAALEASADTYTGYVDAEAQPDPVGPLRERRADARRRYVVTRNGFPLAMILHAHQSQPPRHGHHPTRGPTYFWSGIDRWGREWFGKNAGEGMVTGMRLRRIPTPAPIRRTSGVRSISPVRGVDYERAHLALRFTPYMEIIREQQRIWLERSERGLAPWAPDLRTLVQEREALIALLFGQREQAEREGGPVTADDARLTARIDDLTARIAAAEGVEAGEPRPDGHDQCTGCGSIFDAPAHFDTPLCARCRAAQ